MRTKPSKPAADPAPLTTTELSDFPTVRYFQIHFQYLQEIIGDLKVRIDQANQQISDLQEQLRTQAQIPNINPAVYGIERREKPPNQRRG